MVGLLTTGDSVSKSAKIPCHEFMAARKQSRLMMVIQIKNKNSRTNMQKLHKYQYKN